MAYGSRPYGIEPWGTGNPPPIPPAPAVVELLDRLVIEGGRLDLFIDDDGDYILEAGDFLLTSTAQPAVRHQVLDIRGEWIGDPDSGRERRGLAGRNASAAQLAAEEDSVIVALEELETEGLITDIQTTADRDERGRFVVRASSRDTAAGTTVEATVLTESGV